MGYKEEKCSQNIKKFAESFIGFKPPNPTSIKEYLRK